MFTQTHVHKQSSLPLPRSPRCDRMGIVRNFYVTTQNIRPVGVVTEMFTCAVCVVSSTTSELRPSSKTYSGLFLRQYLHRSCDADQPPKVQRRHSTSGWPVKPYVAMELRGDGPAVEHLATGTEA
eukprot:659761-Prymnesium_polylepis.1